MRKLIFVILFAVGFVSSALADGTLKRVIITKDCGDKCEYYKHGANTGIKPAVPNMVCFSFVQSGPKPVEFMLYSSYDPATKSGTVSRKLKREFGTNGEFCVGSQFVSAAVAVEICNDENHSVRGVPSLRAGLASGSVAMCLLGASCKRFVAEN